MNNSPLGQIGVISADVINTLELSITPETPIYIGQTNINHMISTHNEAYIRYGAYISQIISSPDYVGINPSDSSIEYVKEFSINNDFVKVAVRISNSGKYFARTIYILNNQRVSNFIRAGTLKPLTNCD